MQRSLSMFTIYRNPKDYPGKFVVRQFRVDDAGAEPGPDEMVTERLTGSVIIMSLQPLAVAATLEEAREAVPPGLYNLGRYGNDDAAIAEVWV